MNIVKFKSEILSLRRSGKTYNEIKQILGCCKATVSYHCRRAGIDNPNEFKKPTETIIENFIFLYKNNETLSSISKITGWSRHTIRFYLTKNNITLKKVRTLSRSQSVVDWRKRTKQKLVEYKGSCCQAPGCGYNKCMDALTFHHLDPSQKDFQISGKSWSYERLKGEVDKCALLCSNCHKEVHAGILILPNSN